MATLKLHPQTDDMDSDFGEALVELIEESTLVSRSSTSLVVADGPERLVFTGTNFSFNVVNNEVRAVNSGTVRQISYFDFGVENITLTGLQVSAKALFTALITGNTSAIENLLLGGNDKIILSNKSDEMSGFGGNDTIIGNKGNDTIDGAAGNDMLYGGQGNDRLIGGKGNDSLWGDKGNDTLLGGAGNDLLSGGKGKDVLTGGAGADVFLFTEQGKGQQDRITDFTSGSDKLHLAQSAFAAIANTGAFNASDLAFGKNAGDSSDRLVYHKSSGNLWYDADGSGSAAKVLIATLEGGVTLTAADILIV